MNFIQDFRLSIDHEDEWRWLPSASGKYATASAYSEILRQQPVMTVSRNFAKACKWVWNSLAPIKVSTMGWRLLWKRLPTKSNLIKRGVRISDEEEVCTRCGLYGEDEVHVFYSCEFAKVVWNLIYVWIKHPLIIHVDPVIHFNSHVGIFKSKRGKTISACIWACTVWAIWKARNELIFHNKAVSPERVVEEIKGRIWSWCLVKKFLKNDVSTSAWWDEPRVVI